MKRAYFFLTAMGLLTAMLSIGATPIDSATSAADETLKSKGLTLVGVTYEVDADAHLAEGLRKMMAAKARVDDNARRRASIEADLARAGDLMTKLNAQQRDFDAQLQAMPHKSVRYNDLVARVNQNLSNIRDGVQYQADKEKELKGLVDPSDDYISAVLDVSGTMEVAAKQYEALANDKEVSAAVAKRNEKAPPKVKLGPSAAFAQELPLVRRLRDAINSAVIQCDVSNGTAMVTAVFDGTVKQRVVVDSGASLVLIPADLAAKLGMKPGRNDPVVQSTIANGKKVTEHLMTVHSIRIGQFTVDNVECTVAGANEPNAPCLIGGSFLKHFVYRMDLSTGQLHLSELLKPAAAEKTAPIKYPGPATSPAASLPETPAPEVSAADEPATQPLAKAVELPTGPQKLVCMGGKTALAAPDATPERNKPVIVRASDDGADELWTIRSNGDGPVQLINKKEKMAIAAGTRNTAGIKMFFWPANGKDSQLWTLEPVAGEQTFKVINKGSGFYLTAHASGGAVTQEQWQNLDGQKWRFAAIEK